MGGSPNDDDPGQHRFVKQGKDQLPPERIVDATSASKVIHPVIIAGLCAGGFVILVGMILLLIGGISPDNILVKHNGTEIKFSSVGFGCIIVGGVVMVATLFLGIRGIVDIFTAYRKKNNNN